MRRHSVSVPLAAMAGLAFALAYPLGLVEVVAGAVDDLVTSGETVPQPFAERSYSGTIYVRTSAEVHRRLVMEAAENHVSLNQWAAQRLASA